MATTGQITFLGHSAIRLTLPDERILFIDPWLNGNPLCPKQELQPNRCDYIAITHGHDDHVGDTPALTQKFSPKVITNYDLASVLANLYPQGQYCGMNLGGTQEIDGIRFTMTRAYHSSSVTAPQGPLYAGMPGGFVIQIPELATLYHAGDTDVFSDMALIHQLYAPKILLLPIGDHFTMGPRSAALAAQYFKPSAIIPIHYSTFPILTGRLDDFRNELSSELSSCVFGLNPGQSLNWNAQGVSR